MRKAGGLIDGWETGTGSPDERFGQWGPGREGVDRELSPIFAWVRGELRKRLSFLEADPEADGDPEGRTVTVPVCYGGEFGPDLAEVAARHGLTEAEAVQLHASAEYRVAMIGFVPGFAYLLGLPDRLATPRRASPRAAVPAGAIGIGGSQTGIYPLETPGGWNWIGRTPLELFRPDRNPPCLLQPGDRVRFVPVSPDEFQAAKEAGG